MCIRDSSLRSIILDIDLDFRAPEMSIQEYEKTITQVRKLIFSPQVQCITIATSPTVSYTHLDVYKRQA